MRVKVTDGDLMFINIPSSLNEDSQEELCKQVDRWLKKRGMENVTALLFKGNQSGISFEVLSVNDVFESTVLKGDSDG